jgi:hypothetical protein
VLPKPYTRPVGLSRGTDHNLCAPSRSVKAGEPKDNSDARRTSAATPWRCADPLRTSETFISHGSARLKAFFFPYTEPKTHLLRMELFIPLLAAWHSISGGLLVSDIRSFQVLMRHQCRRAQGPLKRTELVSRKRR